jgi:hypothetical protein
VTIEEKPVTAPFFIATAVFDKLPATQYPPNKADPIFANHCPYNSLLANTLCLFSYAAALATDTVSVKPIKPITTAKSSRFHISL